MKRLKNLLDEKGASAVIVGLVMTVLIGMAGLVIDGGRVYIEKSQMQKSLDTAVISGAQILNIENNEDEAEIMASNISTKNGFPLAVDTEVVAPYDRYYVEASKENQVNTYIAKMFGVNNIPVKARAKAVIRPIIGMRGLVPIAIEEDDYDRSSSVTMIFPDFDPGPGNVGFVDFDHQGGGTSEIIDRLKNGYNGKVSVPQLIHTQTGTPTGAYEAIKERIQLDEGIEKCQSADTADFTCKRLVHVPIIESWNEVNGSSDKVKIVGVAVFFLDELEEVELPDDSEINGNGNGNGNGNNNSNRTEKHVTGQFVTRLSQGEIEEDFDPSTDFGLYSVKLTE